MDTVDQPKSFSDLIGACFSVGKFTFTQAVHPFEQWTVQHADNPTVGYGRTLMEAVYEFRACCGNKRVREQLKMYDFDESGERYEKSKV